MRKRRLNFKARDYITGELKNVGYMEIRSAQENPEEDPDAEQTEDPEEEENPDEDPNKDPEEDPDKEPFPPKQEESEEDPVDLYFMEILEGQRGKART